MKNRFSQMTTSIWQKMALVFLGLTLSLALLEGGMRLGGFVLLSIQEYGNLRSVKQKGAYRILCLGESTTQGAYPKPLEQILNQRYIGVRFSVVDKGIPATGISAIVSRVESYLAEYHPDMVVAMMGVNDYGEHIPFEKVTTSKWTLFIRSFRIYKLARLLELHLLTKAKEMGFYKPVEDRRSSAKAQTPFPETQSSEAAAGPVSIEGSLKETTEPNPKNDRAYAELGRLREDQGELFQAEDLFKKAIELNPKNDRAYAELGLLYRNQGKFSQAEDSYRKVIELNPENDNALLELGRIYRTQGECSKAEVFFKKAFKINPKNENAYFALGGLDLLQGELSQAEASFKKSIELNPANDYAYLALGGLYRFQGKFSQAEDLFKAAMELDSKNERLWRAMASLYEEMGKPDLAKEYTEKANGLRTEYYSPEAVRNYQKLKKILDRKGIKLVCVQYPVRNVDPLKRIFQKDKGVIFVDNERVFKEALKKASYKEYFKDMFGGDFGHCTQKGNELLAQNIADVILGEVFKSEK